MRTSRRRVPRGTLASRGTLAPRPRTRADGEPPTTCLSRAPGRPSSQESRRGPGVVDGRHGLSAQHGAEVVCHAER
jgi:hypothetical protein